MGWWNERVRRLTSIRIPIPIRALQFLKQQCSHTITLHNTTLKTVDYFKYLGIRLSSESNIDADITHRTNMGWQKWRELTGELCYSQRLIKPMVQTVGQTQVSQAYPQRSTGVSLLDKMPNVYIKGSFKVRTIPENPK